MVALMVATKRPAEVAHELLRRIESVCFQVIILLGDTEPDGRAIRWRQRQRQLGHPDPGVGARGAGRLLCGQDALLSLVTRMAE